MDKLLSLADVSARTGESIRDLRQWCATGRLTCERDGRSWMIAERDLSLVVELGAETQARSTPSPVAFVVPADAPLRVNLAAEVARRLGLPATTVAMSTLVIDGQEYAVAVWKDTDGLGGLSRVQELAAELGGDLLGGSTPWPTGLAQLPAEEREGSSS